MNLMRYTLGLLKPTDNVGQPLHDNLHFLKGQLLSNSID